MTIRSKKTVGAPTPLLPRALPLAFVLLLTVVLLLTAACGSAAQSLFLAARDHEIASATKGIDAARDDAVRAAGHSERGRAYSEKARYSKEFKLIPDDEYGRLFGLAIQDHDQAVALAPADARMYFDRGLTYYDRAALEDQADPKTRTLFDSAAADFGRAIEHDSRNARAFDMLGLVHSSTGNHDQAIAAFAQEMALDRHLGSMRLAEAYCSRAGTFQQTGEIDSAISDYRNSMELGVPADGCDCQPETPLAQIYLDKKQYDRSWEIVNRARQSGKWIDPALVEQLKKASGTAQ